MKLMAENAVRAIDQLRREGPAAERPSGCINGAAWQLIYITRAACIVGQT
jgi:hypothetical protein